jgi:hypothetical protein
MALTIQARPLGQQVKECKYVNGGACEAKSLNPLDSVFRAATNTAQPPFIILWCFFEVRSVGVPYKYAYWRLGRHHRLNWEEVETKNDVEPSKAPCSRSGGRERSYLK